MAQYLMHVDVFFSFIPLCSLNLFWPLLVAHANQAMMLLHQVCMPCYLLAPVCSFNLVLSLFFPPLPQVVNDLDEANCLALKTAEAVKEQRQGREQELQRRVSLEIHKEPVVDSDPKLAQTPPTPVNMEDAFTRVSKVIMLKQLLQHDFVLFLFFFPT